ncbi:MAG: hypothetical protein LBP19_09105 [Treponema sp.]|nr:hypothetical protein [Treponema sp.]
MFLNKTVGRFLYNRLLNERTEAYRTVRAILLKVSVLYC